MGWATWAQRIRGIGAGLLARLLPVGLALIGLVCAGFVLLLVRYQRAVSAQVAGLSAYLRRIDAGDYALDVRDNGEGSFSLLKNDLYKVTVRLREQAELLQKDKTALSNLIADISHQIKTPLTSLGVLADLLAEDPPEEDRRAFVERLRAQLGRIQWLVAALLKLARLDAGTAAFKSEPVDVRRLIDRALEPLQIPLEIKKQRLEVHGRRRRELYRRPQLERRSPDQRGQKLCGAHPGGWEDRDQLRRECPVRRDHRQRRRRGDREPGFAQHLQPLLPRRRTPARTASASGWRWPKPSLTPRAGISPSTASAAWGRASRSAFSAGWCRVRYLSGIQSGWRLCRRVPELGCQHRELALDVPRFYRTSTDHASCATRNALLVNKLSQLQSPQSHFTSVY